MSLADTLHNLEKAVNSNRTESGLSSRRANQPDPPSRSPMSLVGPSPTTTRENDDGQPHPRCLPPPAPVREPGVTTGQLWLSRCWSVAHETFGTSDSPAMTWSEPCWVNPSKHGEPFRTRRPRLRLQSPERLLRLEGFVGLMCRGTSTNECRRYLSYLQTKTSQNGRFSSSQTYPQVLPKP